MTSSNWEAIAAIEEYLHGAKLHLQTALDALEADNYSEALRHSELASEQSEKAIAILHE